MAGVLSSFTRFTRKVMTAVTKGGLSKEELGILERMFARTEKKNLILSKGILTALSAGGATKSDVKKFGELLELAHQRILNDKEPFTKNDEKELMTLFEKRYVPEKAARWFAKNLDELVANEIGDFINNRRISVDKKTVRFTLKNEESKKITV